MTFNVNGLGVLGDGGQVGGDGPHLMRVHVYSTSDTPAQVQVAGYFNQGAGHFRPGDMIYVLCGDGAAGTITTPLPLGVITVPGDDGTGDVTVATTPAP